MTRDLGVCVYCLERRAVQIDHFIKKNQARRRPEAMRERENPRFKAPACRECNEAVGTRYRVPITRESLIPELQRLTGNTYATYNGTAEDLRAVVR